MKKKIYTRILNFSDFTSSYNHINTRGIDRLDKIDYNNTSN